MDLIPGMEMDRLLAWPEGRAERLSRRGMLPHIVLPDGSIRFDRDAVPLLLRQVPAATPQARGADPC